mmetsp:Transcript_13427/g.22027  ORF Transcript_13427/g.22027 Transcript_13427/m.22027 type:complete len:472 (+) Transcript_13427:200-1615(+)|eukprot:CAMPEP_0184652440 /NCGR_PEP_ID=MMETSP0308-20130426/10139_1 /TAXON_ID=38269 /ORGANISM="Gloeochaete witrockiana, Strain SAG 46.84" /LENGTH=471 /DNA_ID=CAMNT_0027087317 /DNA_START=173 /DNA_END=1588 /DNA_ORIENTATION=+
MEITLQSDPPLCSRSFPESEQADVGLDFPFKTVERRARRNSIAQWKEIVSRNEEDVDVRSLLEELEFLDKEARVAGEIGLRMMERVRELEEDNNRLLDQIHQSLKDATDALSDKDAALVSVQQMAGRVTSMQHEIERLDSENRELREGHHHRVSVREGLMDGRQLVSLTSPREDFDRKLADSTLEAERLHGLFIAEERVRKRLEAENMSLSDKYTEAEVNNRALQHKLFEIDSELKSTQKTLKKCEKAAKMANDFEEEFLKQRGHLEKLKEETEALKAANVRIQNAKVDDILRIVNSSQQRIIAEMSRRSFRAPIEHQEDEEDEASDETGYQDLSFHDRKPPRSIMSLGDELSLSQRTMSVADELAQIFASESSDASSSSKKRAFNATARIKFQRAKDRVVAVNRWRGLIKECVAAVAIETASSSHLLASSPLSFTCHSSDTVVADPLPRQTSFRETPRDKSLLFLLYYYF